MGPQTAGGGAQVGRGWEGGRRGRRRGEKGGDRMRSRERHPHTEIHAEKLAGGQRQGTRGTEKDRNTGVYGRQSVYTQRQKYIH